MAALMNPEICPICGTEVPPNAKACPGCGSDEETGWSDRARAQELGLPDDEFNYEEFVREEFGTPQKARPHGIKWFWWLAAIAVLIGFLLWIWPG